MTKWPTDLKCCTYDTQTVVDDLINDQCGVGFFPCTQSCTFDPHIYIWIQIETWRKTSPSVNTLYLHWQGSATFTIIEKKWVETLRLFWSLFSSYTAKCGIFNAILGECLLFVAGGVVVFAKVKGGL